ncbi:MAG: hypothetical protein JJT78_17170 [Leptospira sp.]|nr:hypothetical protein [Leptospira sp.]
MIKKNRFLSIASFIFSFMRSLVITLFIALLFSQPLSAEKYLFWESIHVDAHIRKDGVLEVSEIQSIHFHGDWNGAYRYYNVGWNETMEFLSIERKLPNSENWIPLRPGNLNRVDSYEYSFKNNSIKWRARYERDPPFKNQVITYRIKILYYGAVNLLPNGGYELQHDFAFPNRDRGEDIKEMTVSLTWDESWVQEDEVKEGGGAQVGVGGKAEDRQGIFKSIYPIPPRSGFVVRQRLNYIGDKNDLAPYYEDFADYRIGLYLGIIIFLAMTQVWIYRRAVQKGILEKPKLYTTWDEVNNTIGALLPEEVCLIAEHKGKLIETWITRLMNENKFHAGICPDTGVFKLKKLVPDSEFAEEDQKILKGLFVTGGSEITGEDIKAHYKEKKISYSLYLDIFRRYEGLVKNFIEKFKPTNESFWSDIVSIFDYSPYLFLLMYIMFMFFWDGWESIIPKGAGYSKAEFLRDFVIFLFISIGSAIAAHSGLKEKHFGFEDLKSNRKKLFFKSFIGSILLLTIMFILLFWNRFYSYQFYTVFMVLLGIRAFFFLWLASPKYAMNQIRFILDMISSTNFIRSRFQSDDPCDVPIGLSSYLPIFLLWN